MSDDLTKKISDAAAKMDHVPVANLREVFTAGAAFVRGILEMEIERCREIADRDGKDYSDLKAECERLKAQLALCRDALKQILEWAREGDGSGKALNITEASKWTLAKLSDTRDSV